MIRVGSVFTYFRTATLYTVTAFAVISTAHAVPVWLDCSAQGTDRFDAQREPVEEKHTYVWDATSGVLGVYFADPGGVYAVPDARVSDQLIQIYKEDKGQYLVTEDVVNIDRATLHFEVRHIFHSPSRDSDVELEGKCVKVAPKPIRKSQM